MENCLQAKIKILLDGNEKWFMPKHQRWGRKSYETSESSDIAHSGVDDVEKSGILLPLAGRWEKSVEASVNRDKQKTKKQANRQQTKKQTNKQAPNKQKSKLSLFTQSFKSEYLLPICSSSICFAQFHFHKRCLHNFKVLKMWNNWRWNDVGHCCGATEDALKSDETSALPHFSPSLQHHPAPPSIAGGGA